MSQVMHGRAFKEIKITPNNALKIEVKDNPYRSININRQAYITSLTTTTTIATITSIARETKHNNRHLHQNLNE